MSRNRRLRRSRHEGSAVFFFIQIVEVIVIVVAEEVFIILIVVFEEILVLIIFIVQIIIVLKVIVIIFILVLVLFLGEFHRMNLFIFHPEFGRHFGLLIGLIVPVLHGVHLQR